MESNDRYYISSIGVYYYAANLAQWPIGLFITRRGVGSWNNVLTLGIL